jgi:hypothetical protein
VSTNEEFARAYDLWNSFKNEVLYQNRFIVKHEVLDYLKHVAETYKMTIESEIILYRARLFVGETDYLQYLKKDWNEDEDLDLYGQLMKSKNKHAITTRKESGFWGYDEKESFVPINNDLVNDGRANPAYIKYLYTAESPYTALVEVRPYLKSKVSIAEIKVNEELIVANFSYESFGKLDGFEQNLMYLIMSDFSKPSDSDKKSYIPSQYVAEYIKTLGLDGIRFNSSLHGAGRNITIFNYEKCKPIGSKLYEIDDICFEAKGIAPLNEKELIHRKLEPYRKEILNRTITSLQNPTLRKDKEQLL